MSKTPVATRSHPSILIVGIQTPYNKTPYIEAYFHEFRHLVASNDIAYDQDVYYKIRKIDPAYFLTRGKLQDLIRTCEAYNIEEVIVSEPLSAQQERNLGNALDARVYDRTRLILEIFEKRAHTAEGKLQVELAMLHHKKSRLSGRGIHMSQQSGRIGTRGPGETQKEKELQHIERRIVSLKRDIERLHKVRSVQRKKRLEKRVPHVALVGYTNAGKSTILNALTKSDVTAEDRLFATLETTTRELVIDGAKCGVLSDTVGFIRQLPPKLVEAFKSTLMELHYADLILIVVDISHPTWDEEVAVVESILQDMNITQPVAYVCNKRDALPLDTAALEKMLAPYQPHIITSAAEEGGLEELRTYLRHWHHTTFEKPKEQA